MLAKYSDWGQTLSHLETYLRTDIIYIACSSGDQECLDEARNQFYLYLDDEDVSPNVRSPVLRFGMEQDGGQENWDALWSRYLESELSSEKSQLLYGMARTRQVWLLARF
ncbi:ERAP1-like C-terminal domain-containing protein, partial [Salmonella sp. s54395]|uniref:ERAP1-like C-terminal domain-containing protein n=1 Tax=Salmonella sp. s54395 TaxID=3159664 RepID=UPI0039800E8F